MTPELYVRAFRERLELLRPERVLFHVTTEHARGVLARIDELEAEVARLRQRGLFPEEK